LPVGVVGERLPVEDLLIERLLAVHTVGDGARAAAAGRRIAVDPRRRQPPAELRAWVRQLVPDARGSGRQLTLQLDVRFARSDQHGLSRVLLPPARLEVADPAADLTNVFVALDVTHQPERRRLEAGARDG